MIIQLTLLAVLTFAQTLPSNPQTPSPNEASGSKATPVAADLNGAGDEKVPSVQFQSDTQVANLPSTSNNQDTSQDNEEEGPATSNGDIQPKSLLSWLEKYWGLIVAIASAPIVILSVKCVKFVLACIAARRKGILERAYMEPIHVHDNRQDTKSPFEIMVTWTNRGQRPAILKGVAVKCLVVGSKEPMPEFDRTLITLKNHRVGEGQSFTYSTGLKPITESQKLFGKGYTLRGTAYLKYRDVHGWISKTDTWSFTGCAKNFLNDKPSRTPEGGISMFNISFDL